MMNTNKIAVLTKIPMPNAIDRYNFLLDYQRQQLQDAEIDEQDNIIKKIKHTQSIIEEIQNSSEHSIPLFEKDDEYKVIINALKKYNYDYSRLNNFYIFYSNSIKYLANKVYDRHKKFPDYDIGEIDEIGAGISPFFDIFLFTRLAKFYAVKFILSYEEPHDCYSSIYYPQEKLSCNFSYLNTIRY